MTQGPIARAAIVLGLVVATALIVGRWARVGWESYGDNVMEDQALEAGVLGDIPQPQQKITAYLATFEGVCVTHTIVTTKGANESQEDFCTRHSQSVRMDMTGDYPPKRE